MEIVEIWQNLVKNATQIVILFPHFMWTENKKLRKQFRDAQTVPFMLDNTRKPLLPLKNKKHFLKKNSNYFLSDNVVKC